MAVSRRTWIGFAALLPLAGCAGLGVPNGVTVSEAELQRLAERRFPLQRRLLEVLDVRVDDPHLQLLPERNRVAATFRVGAHDRIFGAGWDGHISLESALRYQRSDQTLRLEQVQVTRLTLDDAPAGIGAQADRVGAQIAERMLDGLVIYQLPPERSERLRSAGVEPGAVSITSRGIEITLTPLAR